MTRLRIAYLRINQETNAFTAQDSELTDFQVIRGEALARACGPLGNEAPGFTPWAELSGLVAASLHWRQQVELVPLFSAWAMPSGPLSEAAYLALRTQLTTALSEAGALDGLFLSMHGAMRARGAQPEPEEGFLDAVRDVVGPELPVALTLDLHGQLTPPMVANATIIASYRTNPHWDLFSVGYRAGKLLIRTVLGEIVPHTTWRSLPMVVGGGETLSYREPMRQIFRRMREMERDPRVLYVSLFMCHIWNDSPDLGWSVHIVTDGDPALADRLADELAQKAWAVRKLPPPTLLAPESALRQIRRARWKRKLGVFCLCDASDVVGAGAPGDNPLLLQSLIAHGQGMLIYAPIRDREAVATAWDTAEGTRLTVSVGASINRGDYAPITVSGTLRRKRQVREGRAVVLDMGHLQLVITDFLPYTLKPSFYGRLGLNPWKADILVVKSFFHFRLFHLAISRGGIGVKTRGATDFDRIGEISFSRPVYPKVDLDDWRAADRARRGIDACREAVSPANLSAI